MDVFTKQLIARIDLLERVLTEHDPIIFRSYEVGVEYDATGRLASRSYAFEKNDRLLATAATVEAAEEELREIYRTIQVTEDMPAYVVIEVLAVRLQDQGAEAWCRKIVSLGGPSMRYEWLRDHHIEVVRRHKFEMDRHVRAALILEDGHEEAMAHAADQADAQADADYEAA